MEMNPTDLPDLSKPMCFGNQTAEKATFRGQRFRVNPNKHVFLIFSGVWENVGGCLGMFGRFLEGFGGENSRS